MSEQGQFNFEVAGSDRGFSQRLASRRMAVHDLAGRIGLPLGHKVEVWLSGQIRLRGKLRLREEVLFIKEERLRHLELEVDHVGFTYREIESCVRLD